MDIGMIQLATNLYCSKTDTLLTILLRFMLVFLVISKINGQTSEPESETESNFQNTVKTQAVDVVEEIASNIKLQCIRDDIRVCTSLLMIEDSIVIEEGPYCACEECGSGPGWDQMDGKSLTWYHHERGDWQIQYKFCNKIVPKNICGPKEKVAAVVRTKFNGWKPVIDEFLCQCPGGLYYMIGWFKFGEEHWDYKYNCDRDNCLVRDDFPCVRQYTDRGHTHTIGYKFTCTCPIGYRCPAGKGKVNAYDVDGQDDIGPFVYGYCVRITGWRHHSKAEDDD